jgi:hypothetical protein
VFRATSVPDDSSEPLQPRHVTDNIAAAKMNLHDPVRTTGVEKLEHPRSGKTMLRH